MKDERDDQLTFGERVKYYFTQMEFNSDKQHLGSNAKESLYTFAVYILASLGIFGRQITQFPKIKLDIKNLQWDVFAASMIIGLATLPFFIKRINNINSTPGLHQILGAFGIGFFMDFTTNAVINFYFKDVTP